MNALELAEHYFALSNQGDLESIERLFLPTTTYSSANYGLYFGPKDIMGMMRPFFSQYETRCWTIEESRSLTEHIAEIEFSFTGTSQDGETISRTGVERIVVHSGMIQHIEVRPPRA